MTMPTLETRILWELSTINLEGLDVWLYCYYTHIHATRRSRNELTLHVYKDRSDVETAVTAMMEPPPVQQKKKMEKEFVWSFIFYSLYLSAGFCWYWCPRSSSCRVMFPSQTFNALFCICFGYAERGRDIRSLELHRKGPPWRRHFPFNSFLITKKKNDFSPSPVELFVVLLVAPLFFQSWGFSCSHITSTKWPLFCCLVCWGRSWGVWRMSSCSDLSATSCREMWR